MSWNGSCRDVRPQQIKQKQPRRVGVVRPLIALFVIGIVCVCWFVFSNNSASDKGELRSEKKVISPVAPRNVKPNRRKNKQASIASEYADQVKEFIKKTPGTNIEMLVVHPIDPKDPDNALRAAVTQELVSLLSVEPGEALPPFPYSFMIEDDVRELAANGDPVGEVSNGNDAFMETLAKWKVVPKKTDDQARLEHKSNILAAQAELLAGIDEGISVNDSIRAAYEFRKRAYEVRSTIVNTLTELYTDDGDSESTYKQIKEMNERLAEEGIKKIAIGEIMEDVDDPERTP